MYIYGKFECLLQERICIEVFLYSIQPYSPSQQKSCTFSFSKIKFHIKQTQSIKNGNTRPDSYRL